MIETLLFSLLAFFIVATLYSSVGHAGATGYLAVMALLAFSPPEIKPTALILNIFVASIGSFRYIKAGYFNLKLFLWLAAFSFPAAFLGGYIMLDDTIFRIFAGLYLVVSSFLLLQKVLSQKPNHLPLRNLNPTIAAGTGGIIGFFSGLIGMGGGVFLSPLLLLFRWSNARQTSGITSLFILVNSFIALMGHLVAHKQLPGIQVVYLIPVILGGLLGSWLGTKKLNPTAIYIILAVILLTAGIKMIPFSAF